MIFYFRNAVPYYHLNDIILGDSSQHGHKAYLDARYVPADLPSTKIIFKKNKRGFKQLTRLEVAFSKVAQLFLGKQLTADQHIVVDESMTIVGSAVQNLCYIIAQKEGLTRFFYTFKNPQINVDVVPLIAQSPEDIPLYFLDRVPHGFYHSLLEAEKANQLIIDYSSLATTLTGSYTLEEDDLHKGNLGFYLTEEENKPKVVFFKVDHDLMYVNSVMSFYEVRPFHLFSTDRAFTITADDIINFPNIHDSSNLYWPTKFSYFFNPLNTLNYQNQKELDGFRHLKDIPEFKKTKWMSFYKHILVPQELLEEALMSCLDRDNAIDRADMALIVEATIARQAWLRAVLFSIEEFRLFVESMSEKDKAFLLGEVVSCSKARMNLTDKINSDLCKYQAMCQSDYLVADDSPLHVAIKLGDYRYEETTQMFGQWINSKNSSGNTPFDCALELPKIAENDCVDPRSDASYIMNHLLKNGAGYTPIKLPPNPSSHGLTAGSSDVGTERDSWIPRSSRGNSRWLNLIAERAGQAKSYMELKALLRDIGEDHRYCLKYKKNLAIECIARFIEVQSGNPHFELILKRLKNEVNGLSPEAECAGLKYIRQLRSRLWIIRQIRGLYGWTSTQSEINSMINQALEHIPGKAPSRFSFFNSSPLLKFTLESMVPSFH